MSSSEDTVGQSESFSRSLPELNCHQGPSAVPTEQGSWTKHPKRLRTIGQMTAETLIAQNWKCAD